MKTITSLEFLPRWSVFLFDAFLVSVVFYLSNMLLSGVGVYHFGTIGLIKYLIFITVNIIFFFVFKVYRGVIRHSTLNDIARVFNAQFSSFGVLAALSYLHLYIYGDKLFLTTRLFLAALLSLIILVSYRLFIKKIFERLNFSLLNKNKKDILVYGSGNKAFALASVLSKDENSPYVVKAFYGSATKGTKVTDFADIPIIKSKKKPHVIARKLGVKYLLIADEELSTLQKKQVVENCLEYGIQVLYFPNISDFSNNKKVISNIKNIKIQDLLERKEIDISNERVSQENQGKTVLITGAAGSIGSEIVVQVLKFKPKKIILLDQAETPLHNTTLQINKNKYTDTEFVTIVGDIRDTKQLERIISKHLPDVIYHAAAYKHVPLMEENPLQAIYTNVKGTVNLANLAQKYKVNRFVMVSTDKAVNPSNVMGASKRIAEKYVQSLFKKDKDSTKFITTRFGNVLGSNGSVVPLFTRQIEEGGPITITHPDIIRYFMTIPEACQLVLEAGAMGVGGEVFVFDMGKPVKIIDLARKMIRLAGLTPDEDIEIKTIGLRQGEKLYEELLYDSAVTLPTHHSKIMRAIDVIDDYDQIVNEINEVITLAESGDIPNTIINMKKIVPEFKSLNSKYEVYDKN